jgi:predicted Zn-dependent protease
MTQYYNATSVLEKIPASIFSWESDTRQIGVIAQQVASWSAYNITTGAQNTALGYKAMEVQPVETNITFHTGSSDQQEMLRITKDGFYVRGVKVEQDDKEAERVYNAFKRWMVETELRRPY